jgi:NAD(P)-dependent dehydrogenase (short-subunit alcohol dehydrogenase family)
MTTAFITGANKGIGYATAARLTQAGVRVIIGARDPRKGEEAAAAVRAEDGHLDVLVNNAGILPEATAGADGPLDLGLFRTTFDTNFFGVVATTEAFLPLLTRAPAGRIVNVSSTMGSLADQADPASAYYGVIAPAYQASKAALNSVTIALSKSLAETNVKVNAVCPGWVQTDLCGPDNKAAAPTAPDDAARIVSELALIGADGPTGGFFDEAGPVRW